MNDDQEAFIMETGGGKGIYVYKESMIKGQRNNDKIFNQSEHCDSLKQNKCGFGRLKFDATMDDYKLYLRVQKNSDPNMVLYFMQTVWNLPSPKLLIGITGGAKDFKISPELESILNELMHITRENEAWILTGGTRGGIMKYFGQARFRFGGNIPLIGITTWGSVANREKLEVKPDSFNYGYITRNPVAYDEYEIPEEKQKGMAHLEQNHSHFLLVDDGSSDKFGGEIKFRGELEKCVGTRNVWDAANLMVELNLGWEGGTYSPQEVSKHTHDDGGRTRRICLCFEGGANTIGTVKASVANGTPALVIQDTGRAADLIADYFLCYIGQERARVRPRSSAKTRERQASTRRKMVANLVELMRQDEEDRKTLAEGQPRRLRAAIIKWGSTLNDEYKLKTDVPPLPEELLDLMDSLHSIATSKLCQVHRLGSVKKEEENWMPIAIRESISQCLLLGINKTFDDRLASEEANLKRDISSVPAVPSAAQQLPAQVLLPRNFPLMQAAVSRVLAGTVATENAGDQDSVDQGLAEVKRKLNLERLHTQLKLLTEWGQIKRLDELLREQGQGADDMVSTDVLGRLLQLALLENHPDIAKISFSHGASVEAYEYLACCEKETGEENKVPIWVELLVGASDELEERYLLKLIQKARRSLLPPDQHLPHSDFVSTDDIKDNESAIDILNKICSMVASDNLDEVGALRFDFTKEAGGEGDMRWVGANFNLFLFLILVNRAELAHIFFMRETQRDAASTLANALWACHLCRRLSQLPEVGQFAYHRKNGFETTATEYEDIAKDILVLAYKKSDRFTRQALERPLKQCPQWTLLDLIARGNCRGILSACTEVCIEAVQDRFYGKCSLVATIDRMNGQVHQVLSSSWRVVSSYKSWPARLMRTEKSAGNPSQVDVPGNKAVVADRQLEKADKNGEVPSQSWAKLLICIAVDCVGASYYVYPVLPWFVYAYIWAPVIAIWTYYLHKSICLSIFAMIEELLPIMDLIPSATIGYLLHNKKVKEREEEAVKEYVAVTGEIKLGFVPFDHFILDVLTYCVLAHLLTLVVLMTPAFSTFCIELIILALMLVDAIPDIVFEGIEYNHGTLKDESGSEKSASNQQGSKSQESKSFPEDKEGSKKEQSMANVLNKGFKKYIQNNGERMELVCCLAFFMGFLVRYAFDGK